MEKIQNFNWSSKTIRMQGYFVFESYQIEKTKWR
jgi:hypothetical protein